MRSKEEAHDYRYFPEPDLRALASTRRWSREALSGLPELPRARRDRFVDAVRPSRDRRPAAHVEPAVADYFEDVARQAVDPRAAANWVLTELLGLLNARGLPSRRAPSRRRTWRS